MLNKIKSKSMWKRRINVLNSIQKNLFNFNLFYEKYFSLQLFMISEKISLMEGFNKMKNLYKKYKMVNPVRTLIVSDTEDRELFCFIWNVWEGFNFYKELLMDLLKKDFSLNVKDFSSNEILMKNKKYKIYKILYKPKKKIKWAKGHFKVKIKRIWSRILSRKMFSFFNLLLFWYLKFYNKIFLLIKLILFKLWVYYYFAFNNTNISFSKIFKFKFKNFPWLDLLNFTIINKNYYNLLQQLKFKKQLILNCFNFNPFLQQNFFDYYRSKNLYNDYFFKSVFKSFVMHLGYLVSITKNKTWKYKEKLYNKEKVFFRYKI